MTKSTEITKFRAEYHKYAEEYINKHQLAIEPTQKNRKETKGDAWFYYDSLTQLPNKFRIIHKPSSTNPKQPPGVGLEVQIRKEFHAKVKKLLETTLANENGMTFRPAIASFSIHISTPRIDADYPLSEQHENLNSAIESAHRLQMFYIKNKDLLNSLTEKFSS